MAQKNANNNTERSVISIMVDNHPNVLNRITSLFGRRGFNIDSLTVSATDNPDVSRITVVVHESGPALDQILLQTKRLYETRDVFVLDNSHSLQRELLLIKVACSAEQRPILHENAEIYKAKIVDLAPESMVFELTGKPEKIDGFLGLLDDFTILEMCRTGITALARG